MEMAYVRNPTMSGFPAAFPDKAEAEQYAQDHPGTRIIDRSQIEPEVRALLDRHDPDARSYYRPTPGEDVGCWNVFQRDGGIEHNVPWDRLPEEVRNYIREAAAR